MSPLVVTNKVAHLFWTYNNIFTSQTAVVTSSSRNHADIFFSLPVHTLAQLYVMFGSAIVITAENVRGRRRQLKSSEKKKVRNRKWEDETTDKNKVRKHGELMKSETVKHTKKGTKIHLVGSLSRMRKSVRNEKTEWWQGKSRRMSSLPVSASKPCRVIYSLAPTHSSSQCLRLMSQVPLSGSCNTPPPTHSHYRSPVQGDNLLHCTHCFYFHSLLSRRATFLLSCTLLLSNFFISKGKTFTFLSAEAFFFLMQLWRTEVHAAN